MVKINENLGSGAPSNAIVEGGQIYPLSGMAEYDYAKKKKLIQSASKTYI